MNATGKRGAARRAGAATGLASFAIVAGYWLLRAWAGDGAVPGAETVLVRSAVAAVAGFVLGWAGYSHARMLLGETAGGPPGTEQDENGDYVQGDEIEGGHRE